MGMRSWGRKQWMAIVSALVFILAEIVYSMPADQSWILWQGRLRATAIVILGVAQLPLVILPPQAWVFNILYGAVIGFCIGWVIQRLWKQEWWGKAVVVAALLGNACLASVLVLSFGNYLISSPDATCEYPISSSCALWIMAYPEPDFLGGRNYFFATTRDSGEDTILPPLQKSLDPLESLP